MLNFKEYMQNDDFARTAYLSSDQTGSETGNRLPSLDVDIMPVEKSSVINRIDYTKNPIKIGMTDGTTINIPYDQLKMLLGRGDPLKKLKYGANMTVRFQTPSQNSRVEFLRID